MAAFAITQVVLDEATLFNIAVDPAYQRRGLGRALLEHVIDEVEKLGVVTLWLQPQRDDAEFFDFINDMLQQRSPQAAALVRGIDGDIEQRRLIQHHLRNGESRHFAIYR